MVNLKQLIPAYLCISGIFPSYSQNPSYYISSESHPWQKQKVTFVSSNNISSYIDLDNAEKLQTVKGVGGCFNEMGWDALQYVTPQKRDEIFHNIFSEEGAAFSFCRLPIGANDFALSWYSSDDVPNDYELKNFNIDRDRYILLPYIKYALRVNPGLKLWASPWCPPEWMKINGHYASSVFRENYAGLDEKEIIVPPATAFKMERGTLDAYARYFANFIKAYDNEGVKIEFVMPQNEPLANQWYPSCIWRSEDLSLFVGRFLGPELKRQNLTTGIYYGTINCKDPQYVKTALNDTTATKYISGVGFQWDGKDAIPDIHRDYPDIDLTQTESECGNGKNEWSYAEYTWRLIKHYFRNGVSIYDYWNMVLPANTVNRWGWHQNSMLSIDKTTGEITYNPEFYVMKHLGHFLKSGARLLDTSSDILAFLNPDESVVVHFINDSDGINSITVKVHGKYYKMELGPHSFATLKAQ